MITTQSRREEGRAFIPPAELEGILAHFNKRSPIMNSPGSNPSVMIGDPIFRIGVVSPEKT
jgi:hypothetical protein